MARGSDQARGAATSAQNLSNTFAGNASGLYGALAPTLISEAAHPAGIDPVTRAAMDTASQESAGGGMAAATGQGALLAARTRNAGGAQAAIADAARGAGERLSDATLKTRLADASMREKQRQGALSGLGNLYNENAGQSVGSLGAVASNVNANTNAANASWDWAKDFVVPLAQAGASAAAKAYTGGG